MTQIPTGGRTADRPAEIDPAWRQLEDGLTAYLTALWERTFTTIENDLVLRVPTGDERTEASVRIWFDGYLNATVIGPGVRGDWPRRLHPIDARRVAHELVEAVRHLGVPTPALLTYSCTGPCEDVAAELCLVKTGAVVAEPTQEEVTEKARRRVLRSLAVSSRNPERLHALVGIVLADILGEEPTVDDDGDYVLEHEGQYLYVRPLKGQPAVQIFARVVHGVASRRLAAANIAQLNRDHMHCTWVLWGSDIVQQIVLPADPFAQRHLRGMLTVFQQAMSQTRSDLALRTGGSEG